MMDYLTASLAARLDEDERELANDPPHGLGYANLSARMLREITAKRVIVKRHQPQTASYGPLEDRLYCEAESSDEDLWYANPWPCADILALAAIYSDHPDYRAEWAPSGKAVHPA